MVEHNAKVIDLFGDKMQQKTIYQMVEEFHEVMGLPIDLLGSDTTSDDSIPEVIELRDKLIDEEATEVIEADSLEGTILELADLQYVLDGYLVTLGISEDTFYEVCSRVHARNMNRCIQEDGTVHYREDGKVLKREGVPEVDISDLI